MLLSAFPLLIFPLSNCKLIYATTQFQVKIVGYAQTINGYIFFLLYTHFTSRDDKSLLTKKKKKYRKKMAKIANCVVKRYKRARSNI